MEPVASVITIVRNCVKTIEATIESVLSQSWVRMEYIVVDGGSTDGTAEIVKGYGAQLDQWISEPDRGISDALNKGMRMARGDLMLFMNAGDTFVDSTALERAMAAIDRGMRIRETIFYGDALFVNGEGSHRLEPDHERLGEDSVLCHQSVLIGADVQRANAYDERFKIAMDYDLWLRCLGRYEFVKLPVLLSNYAAGGISSSDKYVVRSIIERGIARIINQQGESGVRAVGELLRELVVKTGKLRLKRMAGPNIYGKVKRVMGR
jgi:glycosyltransferase involved in cell wall biosynthesis